MKSLKIFVILGLISLSWGKAVNIEDQIKAVTANADEYDITPDIAKQLTELMETIQSRKKSLAEPAEPTEPTINEDEQDIALPNEDEEEMCDDCEIDLEKEDKAQEEFNKAIEDDYDDQSVTLSSKAIGIICVVAILGLVGATFLVFVCVKFLCNIRK